MPPPLGSFCSLVFPWSLHFPVMELSSPCCECLVTGFFLISSQMIPFPLLTWCLHGGVWYTAGAQKVFLEWMSHQTAPVLLRKGNSLRCVVASCPPGSWRAGRKWRQNTRSPDSWLGLLLLCCCHLFPRMTQFSLHMNQPILEPLRPPCSHWPTSENLFKV